MSVLKETLVSCSSSSMLKELDDPASVKSDLTVGTVVPELGILNAKIIIGSWGGRGQVKTASLRGKGMWLSSRMTDSKQQSQV